MTSGNDQNAQHYFDAAKDTIMKGELADDYNELASSPELLAARQKSEDLKEQEQDFSKVLSGAIDPSQSIYISTKAAEVIVAQGQDDKKNGKKKDDLIHILTIQAINARIADLEAGYNAYQDIFDNYTDDQICAGEHLDANGKFKDPKAEEYWQKYCELHGLDPNDTELRKNPEILHSVQDWIQEEKKAARAIRDKEMGTHRAATSQEREELTEAQKRYEASYEVAKAGEETAGLKTEEQELADFAMIRSDGLMMGIPEAEIIQAERDELSKLSDGAKEILKSDPDNQYLYEKAEPDSLDKGSKGVVASVTANTTPSCG